MSKILLLFLPEMYYVIWELKKEKTKQNNWQKGKQLFKKCSKKYSATDLWPTQTAKTDGKAHPNRVYRFHVFHELKYLKGIRKGKSVNWPTERASNQNISNRRTFGYPFLIYIFSYFETAVVGKSARNNPVRYCGWFWVRCFSKE